MAEIVERIHLVALARRHCICCSVLPVEIYEFATAYA